MACKKPLPVGVEEMCTQEPSAMLRVGQVRLPAAAGLLESQRRSVRKGKGEMTVGEGRANLFSHLESIKHHWAHWEGLSLSEYLKQEDPL